MYAFTQANNKRNNLVLLEQHFSELYQTIEKLNRAGGGPEQVSALVLFLFYAHDFILMLDIHLSQAPAGAELLLWPAQVKQLFSGDFKRVLDKLGKDGFNQLASGSFLAGLESWLQPEAAAVLGPYERVRDNIKRFCDVVLPLCKSPHKKTVELTAQQFHTGEIEVEVRKRINEMQPWRFLATHNSAAHAKNPGEEFFYLCAQAYYPIDSLASPTLNFVYMKCEAIKPKATLIFISDIFNDCTEFSLVYPAFRDEYDILIIDNPGVGLSALSAPIEGSYVNVTANEIHKLVLAFNIRQPYIIGHGLGGHIAIALYQLVKVKGYLVLLNTPLQMLDLNMNLQLTHFYHQIFSLSRALNAKVLDYCKRYYQVSDTMQGKLEKAEHTAQFCFRGISQVSFLLGAYRDASYGQVSTFSLVDFDKERVVVVTTTDDFLKYAESGFNNVKECKRIKKEVINAAHGVLDEAPELFIKTLEEIFGLGRPRSDTLMGSPSLSRLRDLARTSPEPSRRKSNGSTQELL
jgi:pimeloyl-ACP methyl ester carboxylesterase